MLVARFSVHVEQPWISPKARRLGSRKWLIKIHAGNGPDRSTDEIRNQNPCNLVDVLDTATQCIDDMLTELDMTVTDAGFQVFLLR
ncbi:hypothetical protein SAMN04515663_101407 [Alcanivorax sp. DSM 26293]|jgi:hypothetical protein|uniref:hypothetical protein n=1 Tax=Alcanivorax sp. DSM 26293 TaxID=1798238 RepID=UPI0008A09410|nr:hypothetical protein [Alcanivorax sp. DSM 26293]SEF44720.1 hypothetical protein SAMN04515663_101407 [Alcanivorax sp. DSM 26293]